MQQTKEPSIRAPLPNPLRLPLLLAVGVIVVWGVHWWMGARDGLYGVFLSVSCGEVPEWKYLVNEEYTDFCLEPTSVSLHDFFIHWLAAPLWLLLVIGLLFTSIRSGAARAEAAMRYALGSNRSEHMAGAAFFLSVLARVVTWGGLLVGLALLLLFEIVRYRFGLDPSYERYMAMSELLQVTNRWILAAPLAGIVLGRIVFGALAEGARIRANEAGPPVFSWWQDLACLLLFVVPAYFLGLIVWWHL